MFGALGNNASFGVEREPGLACGVDEATRGSHHRPQQGKGSRQNAPNPLTLRNSATRANDERNLTPLGGAKPTNTQHRHRPNIRCGGCWSHPPLGVKNRPLHANHDSFKKRECGKKGSRGGEQRARNAPNHTKPSRQTATLHTHTRARIIVMFWRGLGKAPQGGLIALTKERA